jgi:hypothetical protein
MRTLIGIDGPMSEPQLRDILGRKKRRFNVILGVEIEVEEPSANYWDRGYWESVSEFILDIAAILTIISQGLLLEWNQQKILSASDVE